MTIDSVRVKLQQIAGVEPSSHWLEACRNELRLITGTNVSVDAILEQILHHDLRDVVRELDDNNSSGNTTGSSCMAARELRRAQHQSLQASHNYKAKLPENFRLLVQVEEFLDVSVNAEVRLAAGPASTSAPTAVGNQQNRCLKMVYSDGHYPNIENTPPPPQTQQQQDLFFLAMELTPIPDLSVQSYAGIKILLTGAMEFRHGMALWHEGNTTVLGGQVEDLVQVQRKALQQAKLVAGVGVDPTIKALIWNPETTGLPEEEDEGENESRDVTAGAPLAPAVSQQQQQPPMHPPPPRPPATRTLSQTISSSVAAVNRGHVPPPVASTSSNPVVPPSRSSNNFGRLSPTPSAQFQQVQQPQQQTRTIPPAAAASTRRANTMIKPQAPPVSSHFVTAASMIQGQPSAPSSQHQHQQEQTNPVNPYMRGVIPSSSASSSNHHPTLGTSATSAESTPAASTSVSSSTPMSSASSVTSPPMSTTSAATVTMTSAAQRNNSNYPNHLSYDQLYERVQHAVQDIHAYRQLYDQVFSVQLKQVGFKEYFNIERRKNRPKGDDKKHEYVMGARFQGIQGGNEPISCRVDSCILEPHFAHPPGEMRKLSKTNKEEANNFVREGGRKVLAQLQVPRYYEVSLHLSPEEYFEQEDDKKWQQVLLLRKLL